VEAARIVVESAGLGVENPVAFMAAHRTAMNESRAVFDQSEIARIQVKAPLREVLETDGNSHRKFWMEWISRSGCEKRATRAQRHPARPIKEEG
jgi:hypothetical protein